MSASGREDRSMRHQITAALVGLSMAVTAAAPAPLAWTAPARQPAVAEGAAPVLLTGGHDRGERWRDRRADRHDGDRDRWRDRHERRYERRHDRWRERRAERHERWRERQRDWRDFRHDRRSERHARRHDRRYDRRYDRHDHRRHDHRHDRRDHRRDRHDDDAAYILGGLALGAIVLFSILDDIDRDRDRGRDRQR